MALKLMYGPPERRLTVQSRMLCAPGNAWSKNLICFCPEETGVIFNKVVVAGPAICNATHMTVAIPAFPGTLMAVGAEDKIIPMDQLQENGIALDTKTGVKLHISREVLKSRVSSDLQVTGTRSSSLITTPWCLVKVKATVL